MTAEIKSSLQDIWSKDHLTFDNFQIFKQEKVDKLVDKFPQKYCEVQEDSSEDEVEITEEVVKKGRSRGSKSRKKKPTPPAKKPLSCQESCYQGKGAFRMGRYSILKQW